MEVWGRGGAPAGSVDRSGPVETQAASAAATASLAAATAASAAAERGLEAREAEAEGWGTEGEAAEGWAVRSVGWAASPAAALRAATAVVWRAGGEAMEARRVA